MAVLIAALVAGCSSRSEPTAAQAADLTATRAGMERCVLNRMSALAGVTPAAARALARSLSVACRTERDALEATAVTILGEDGAEEELAAMEAWIFRVAERRALDQSIDGASY